MTRTSTGRYALVPSARTSRFSSTRSSLGCRSSGSSPISSRKMVPPAASSNAPARARLRAGERALLVTEQLALEQVGGDRAAVDDHERLLARALASWIASRRLPLAGAGLALEQHGRVAGRRALEQRERPRAGTDMPPSAPNDVRSETSRRLPPSASSKRSLAAPRRIRLPLRRNASTTRTPSTTVPLRLPRSTMRTRSAATRISQWNRDTVSSASCRSLPAADPIEHTSPDDSHGPAPGPPSTMWTRNRPTIGDHAAAAPSCSFVPRGSSGPTGAGVRLAFGADSPGRRLTTGHYHAGSTP